MADQKSRGGQKEAVGRQPHGGEHRENHQQTDAPSDRSMKEPAARGQQGRQGGYHGQHGSNQKND